MQTVDYNGIIVANSNDKELAFAAYRCVCCGEITIDVDHLFRYNDEELVDLAKKILERNEITSDEDDLYRPHKYVMRKCDMTGIRTYKKFVGFYRPFLPEMKNMPIEERSGFFDYLNRVMERKRERKRKRTKEG